jgi:hypothetical protein
VLLPRETLSLLRDSLPLLRYSLSLLPLVPRLPQTLYRYQHLLLDQRSKIQRVADRSVLYRKEPDRSTHLRSTGVDVKVLGVASNAIIPMPCTLKVNMLLVQ